MNAIPSGFATYLTAFKHGLMPDEPLWVDEWADANMMIPASTGAAEPGKYRIARTPYVRAILRALSPEHPARYVVVMGASQMLKTQALLSWKCALIDKAPANMAVLEPDDNLARRVARRFQKTVDAIPILARKVASKTSRDTKNTGTVKEFHGGTIFFLSGESTSALAEASIKYVAADEVDRIKRNQKGEGSTIALLRARQASFGRNAKSFFTSSPTEEDTSEILALFLKGNQHKPIVHCPHCGEPQTLEWENLRWTPELTKAWMVCPAHGCMIEEHHKTAMFAAGIWESDTEGDGETWSYTISFLYAPLGWDSWLTLAKEWIAADKDLKAGNPELMQVFYNTRLARCWSPIATRIKPEILMQKAEAYPLGICPMGALAVTASVDVQGNRIELQLTGWGPGNSGLEVWIINTHVIYGDPTLPDVWNTLDAILQTPVQHATGALLTIETVNIDSGDGDSVYEVYEFIRPRRRRYVNNHLQTLQAVKGSSQSKKPVIAGKPGKSEYNYKGKTIAKSAEIWPVGTDTAKDWIFNRLMLDSAPVIHTSHELPLDFYQQILNEVKVTEWNRGKKRQAYRKVKSSAANEQLDMLVYNLAAAHHLGLHRLTREQWKARANQIKQADLIDLATLPPPVATAAKPTEPKPQPASAPAAPMPPPRAKPPVNLDHWSQGFERRT